MHHLMYVISLSLSSLSRSLFFQMSYDAYRLEKLTHGLIEFVPCAGFPYKTKGSLLESRAWHLKTGRLGVHFQRHVFCMSFEQVLLAGSGGLHKYG